MNKKIIAFVLIGMFVLIGIGFAMAKEKMDFLKKDKTLKLNSHELQKISEYKITNPSLSECKRVDDYFCKANLYQENGVNKEFVVNYNYCIEYEFIPERQECVDDECITQGAYYSNNCIRWETLTDTEIENELSNQVKKFLKDLSKVKDKRDLDNNQTLSSELNIVLDVE